MTYWKLEFDRIQKVEVVRETDTSIWMASNPERRVAKIASWRAFFPSWEEAHAHLMQRCEQEVEKCRQNLAYAQGKLGNARGMKKP